MRAAETNARRCSACPSETVLVSTATVALVSLPRLTLQSASAGEAHRVTDRPPTSTMSALCGINMFVVANDRSMLIVTELVVMTNVLGTLLWRLPIVRRFKICLALMAKVFRVQTSFLALSFRCLA